MRDEARKARQEQIETAAYGVMEAKGYAGLSMLAVAKAAKASNETLYRWYGDKTGLFEALIARNIGVVRAALEKAKGVGGDDARATLERVGPVLVEMLLGPRAVALNRAAAADGSGTLGKTLAKGGRETVAPWIADVMEMAVEQGHFHGAPHEEMVEVWLALLVADLQVRRVTGAMAELSPEAAVARSRAAMARLDQLFGAS